MGERRNKIARRNESGEASRGTIAADPALRRVSCTEGSMMRKPKSPGRPARPVVTLPATAEEIAHRFFKNAKPPQSDRVAEEPETYHPDEKAPGGDE